MHIFLLIDICLSKIRFAVLFTNSIATHEITDWPETKDLLESLILNPKSPLSYILVNETVFPSIFLGLETCSKVFVRQDIGCPRLVLTLPLLYCSIEI